MANRNWGLITSGATFEALAITLVYFEDQNAALFGRRGIDGGQDARSGDGQRVFQAKHHEDGSATKAISDAKNEAAKIAKYRKQGHSRYNQWKDVTHWRLVTNAVFNPTDKERWDGEVVPLFVSQGLNPDYWERVNLDALLDKHPEVDRYFFQNETRAFLSLPEIRERLRYKDSFLKRDRLIGYRGREEETNIFRKFLSSDAIFLVVHGEGGIGKTRLLLESGDDVASGGEWQVLWANVATMSASGQWFESIVPERATLLLVDEPEDPQLLRLLSEQLGGRVGRATRWKVAIAVRSPKDPVLRFLFSPEIKKLVRELQLGELSSGAAEEMCLELLNTGPLTDTDESWRKDVARKLAARFARRPIWVTLAVHVLEEHGDLSKVAETAADLASQYMDEVVGLGQLAKPEEVLPLLRYIALLGTINREDKATIDILMAVSKVETDTSVRKILADLVKRRALMQRGAHNRLVEIKPDVIRDYILLSWLTVDVGHGPSSILPSSDANKLVQDIISDIERGSISAIGRTILESLARTEFLLKLQGKEVPLLAPFFVTIRLILLRMAASQRLALAEALVVFAEYRPVNTVQISRALRSSPVREETTKGLFGDREISQDDIIMSLAWPIYHAAMGAQSQNECEVVLRELCEIAEAEAEVGLRRKSGLSNDGRSAAQLIERTIAGGPYFSADFTEAASIISRQLLDDIRKEGTSIAKGAVIKALLEPTLSVERQQTWSEGFSIAFSRLVIPPGHLAWENRAMLLTKVREILASDTAPFVLRQLLWRIYDEAHRSVNYCRTKVGTDDQRKQMRQALLEDLKWAYPILDRRKDNLAELKTARGLWHWHYQFDDDPELKEISGKLEALYDSNSLASEFEPLTSYDQYERRDTVQAEKASELATTENPEGIGEFLARAINYFDSTKREPHELLGVALKLGEHAMTSDKVREFVKSSLSESLPAMHADFAVNVAVSWAGTIRKKVSPKAALDQIRELMTICGNDEQRIRLVRRQYGGGLHPDHGQMDSSEHDFLRSLRELFMQNKQGPIYIEAVAWTLDYKWAELKVLIEGVLERVERNQLAPSLRNLLDTVYYAVRISKSQSALPVDLGPWLLDQLLRLPELEDIGPNAEWYIEDLLKRIGKVRLTWLVAALARRREMEMAGLSDKVTAVSYHPRLTKFVMPVAEEQKGDPETVKAIGYLVDLLPDKTSLGYYMPDFLHEVDPEGMLVPGEIVSRLSRVSSRDEARRFARVAGTYAIGSTSWRIIARPVLVSANKATSEEERRELFGSVLYHGMRSWSGTPGQVPQLFLDAVKEARTLLNSETDETFRPFWEWNLVIAEAEFKAQEEEAKEMRGE